MVGPNSSCGTASGTLAFSTGRNCGSVSLHSEWLERRSIWQELALLLDRNCGAGSCSVGAAHRSASAWGTDPAATCRGLRGCPRRRRRGNILCGQLPQRFTPVRSDALPDRNWCAGAARWRPRVSFLEMVASSRPSPVRAVIGHPATVRQMVPAKFSAFPPARSGTIRAPRPTMRHPPTGVFGSRQFCGPLRTTAPTYCDASRGGDCPSSLLKRGTKAGTAAAYLTYASPNSSLASRSSTKESLTYMITRMGNIARVSRVGH